MEGAERFYSRSRCLRCTTVQVCINVPMNTPCVHYVFKFNFRLLANCYWRFPFMRLIATLSP